MLGISSAWLGLLSLTAAAMPAGRRRGESRDASSPPRNVMYVQTFRTAAGGQLSLLPLVQQNPHVTHIYLAALHVNPDPGDIHLNDDNPNSTVWNTVWSEAARLQQAGVKVMVMMGGAAPGSYPRLCSGGDGAVINEAYYAPLRDTLSFHQVDGLDLDIEEAVDLTCPLALLRRLDRDFGSDFILTMAPVASELQPLGYGLGGFSYQTLDTHATSPDRPHGKLVTWFNAQFYNGWGDAGTPNGYNAIVANGYAAARVVLGLLGNPAEGGSGWYGIETYRTNIAALLSAHGAAFGGVAGWEYWDAGARDGLSDPWKWARRIGQSVFAAAAAAGPAQADRAAHVTPGVAPWPELTAQMVTLGAPFLAAVRALNITHGDGTRAQQLLGITP